jgi:hypothetical protein
MDWETIQVADIIREKFTMNYYLVLHLNKSARTGNTTFVLVRDINTGVLLNIWWDQLPNFKLEA